MSLSCLFCQLIKKSKIGYVESHLGARVRGSFGWFSMVDETLSDDAMVLHGLAVKERKNKHASPPNDHKNNDSHLYCKAISKNS